MSDLYSGCFFPLLLAQSFRNVYRQKSMGGKLCSVRRVKKPFTFAFNTASRPKKFLFQPRQIRGKFHFVDYETQKPETKLGLHADRSIKTMPVGITKAKQSRTCARLRIIYWRRSLRFSSLVITEQYWRGQGRQAWMSTAKSEFFLPRVCRGKLKKQSCASFVCNRVCLFLVNCVT